MSKNIFLSEVFRFFRFSVFWLTCYLSFSPAATAQTQQEDPCPEGCMQEDTLVVETYYPSPYGLYEELRGDKIIVGDTEGSVIGSTEATLPPAGTLTFKPLASEPLSSSGTIYEGSMYYDDTYNKFRYYDGSDWQDVGGAGAYWDQSSANSNDIYYTQSGNVGIGVEASDTIAAKVTVKSNFITASVGTTYNFSFTGAEQKFTVPDGVTQINITAVGASSPSGVCGQNWSATCCSGGGAILTGSLTVAPREILYIYVGGSTGYNGGGSGGGGSSVNGGGATDIRRGGRTRDRRILVAAGGGGQGYYWSPYTGGNNTKAGDAESNTGGGGLPGDTPEIGTGGNGMSMGRDSYDCGDMSGGGGGGYHGGAGGSIGPCSANGGAGGTNLLPAGFTAATQSRYSSPGCANPGGVEGNLIISVTQVTMPPNILEIKNNQAQILNIVDSLGNLAIGSSSANGYKLYVNGNAYTTGSTWATSDLRFKENILPLNNSLDKILNIQPVSFDWNNAGFPDMNFEQNRQIGLVAQEVEREIPELVRTDANGYKSIAYDKLTVVTIEAVKEQQKKIEELKTLLKEQKESIRQQQKEIELLKAEEKNNKPL